MKIFVGCGSSPTVEDNYLEETKKVCNMLCSKDYDLVYGSYDSGMMGVCLHTFLDNGRDVYGVNVKAYDKCEYDTYYEEYDTAFERLKRIREISDKFLILPGALGSMSELFGLLEENVTNKKGEIIIYNYNGFYDKLLEFIDSLKSNGFISDINSSDYLVVNTLDELEEIL